jgi:hypothetical protein
LGGCRASATVTIKTLVNILADRPPAGATRDDLIELYLQAAHGDVELPQAAAPVSGRRSSPPADEEIPAPKRMRGAAAASRASSVNVELSEGEDAEPVAAKTPPKPKGRRAAKAAPAIAEAVAESAEEAEVVPGLAKSPRGRLRKTPSAAEAEAAAAAEPVAAKTPKKRAGKAAAAGGPTASAACLSLGETVELDRCRFEVGAVLAAGADSTIFRGRRGLPTASLSRRVNPSLPFSVH